MCEETARAISLTEKDGYGRWQKSSPTPEGEVRVLSHTAQY